MTNTEVEVAICDHQNEIGSLKHRMDKAESNIEQIHELITCVKLLAQKQEGIIHSIDDIKTDVRTLKDEPAKKWNNATQTIISGVISAIVCAIMAVIISRIGG